jgi:hypothetical protein
MRWRRDTTDDAGTQRLGEVGKNEAKPQDPEEGEAHASSHQALGYQTPAAMYFGNWNAHEQTERGDTMGRPTCESLLLGLPDAKFFCGKPAASKKNRLRRGQANQIRTRRLLQRWVQGKGLKRRPFPCDPIPASNAGRENTNSSLKIGEHLEKPVPG